MDELLNSTHRGRAEAKLNRLLSLTSEFARCTAFSEEGAGRANVRKAGDQWLNACVFPR